jgi:hypothetical protein
MGSARAEAHACRCSSAAMTPIAREGVPASRARVPARRTSRMFVPAVPFAGSAAPETTAGPECLAMARSVKTGNVSAPSRARSAVRAGRSGAARAGRAVMGPIAPVLKSARASTSAFPCTPTVRARPASPAVAPASPRAVPACVLHSAPRGSSRASSVAMDPIPCCVTRTRAAAASATSPKSYGRRHEVGQAAGCTRRGAACPTPAPGGWF